MLGCALAAAIGSFFLGFAAMHAVDVEELRDLIVSRTLRPATKFKPAIESPLLVGFDSEWEPATRRLLSVQFAVEVGGELVSHVFDPPENGLTARSLLALVREFCLSAGVEPLPDKNGIKRVYLIAHFAQAELGMVDGALRDLEIRQLNKAHHATFPTSQFSDGLWSAQLVDLFAFFATSLKAVGTSIGLEKLEEDRTDLASLKKTHPDRYNAYAARDAEIAAIALARFREQLLDRWDVDVLRRPSLASVAGEVFRRNHLESGPAPVKRVEVPAKRKRKDGTWVPCIRREWRFAGDENVRLQACLSYWGGRVEAFVRGHYIGQVVERDVVSLYPHASLLQPLPNANTRWTRVYDLNALREMEGFGRFEFAFPSDLNYPSLPVVREGVVRLCFPRFGVTDCTFAEVRAALDLGAKVRIVAAHGFLPGASECEHDLAKYLRTFIKEKAEAKKGTLQYVTAKLLLNSLIGKFGERLHGTTLLAFEREARQAGNAGLGAIVAASGMLRDALRGHRGVGALFAPEWACLILGRARALMAPIVARGALLVSTDSVIIPADLDVSCSGLSELERVGSGLSRENQGDAVFIARSRLYAILKRADHLEPDEKPLARDDTWAVIKVARHGSVETKEQYAETLLACLREGRDVAPERVKIQLVGAERSVRLGVPINSELQRSGRTLFKWDGKRKLTDRDANVFTTVTTTTPYATLGRLEGAEQQRLVRRGQIRKRRRRLSKPRLDEALRLVMEGVGIREIARRLGIPKSTVADLARKLNSRPG